MSRADMTDAHLTVALPKKMKLILLYFITFAIFEVNAAKTVNQYTIGVRFRSVKCSTDNDTVLLDRCYLKAYSRKNCDT